MLFFEKKKKRKPLKPDAKARQLAADWDKLLASHANPLVRGAKANGLKVKTTEKGSVLIINRARPEAPRQVKDLPVPITKHSVGTKPTVDVLAEAKAGLMHRLGQVYPKGAPQYMTDSDLADSKAGLLRRRS